MYRGEDAADYTVCIRAMRPKMAHGSPRAAEPPLPAQAQSSIWGPGRTAAAAPAARDTPENPPVTAPPLPGRSLFDRPYLLLSLTSLFWAINIVLGRFIAGTIPPAALSEIRWVGAGVILLPFAWRHLRRDWPTIRGTPASCCCSA